MPLTNFEVQFQDPFPIRMASEYYDTVRTEVRGLVNLDFPAGLQDVSAEDTAQGLLYLVAWAIQKVEPGFIVLKIDPKVEKIFCSERIKGCCHKIEVTGLGVRVVALQYPDGTSESKRYQPIGVESFPNEYKGVVTKVATLQE